jgi:hypothetical protein
MAKSNARKIIEAGIEKMGYKMVQTPRRVANKIPIKKPLFLVRSDDSDPGNSMSAS